MPINLVLNGSQKSPGVFSSSLNSSIVGKCNSLRNWVRIASPLRKQVPKLFLINWIFSYLCAVKCVRAYSLSVLVIQLGPTLCDPMDCSPPGSPIPGILQARILELPFPSPGDLPNLVIEPGSSALHADSLPPEPPSGYILESVVFSPTSMATHSSVLAWRIPGTGEPDGLPPMGSHRVGHDWSDLAVAVTL